MSGASPGSLSGSDDGDKDEDGAEEEAVALDEEETEATSDIRSDDRRRARDCAEGIAAAVEATTPADAIKVLTKAIPSTWPAQARSLLVSKLQSPRLRFFPTHLPCLTLHPSSTAMDDALWAFAVDDVIRVPPSRASCNMYQADMIVESSGVEWLICGFILPHATSADKLHVLQDLTKQPATVDWIAVLYHAALLGHKGAECKVTSEVC